MKKLTVLSLIALSLLLNARAESYVSTHSEMVHDWNLVLPAVVNGRAFVMAGMALEILDVRVDGVSQSPTLGGVSREDLSVYPQSMEAVIYTVSSDSLIAFRWKDGKKQGGQLIKFSLPCTATRIDIRYVIHLSDGSSSKEVTLTSFEINALEQIGHQKPKQSLQPTPPEGQRG